MDSGSLVALVVLAVALAYVNGFHDASNAVSTAITTRTLRESTALGVAATLNLLGGLLGAGLMALGAGWSADLLQLAPLANALGDTPDMLGLVLCAVALSTLAWSVFTWWMGMPTSTWHTILGAVLGASWVVGASIPWDATVQLIMLPLLIGPLVAVALSFLLMRGLLALGRTELLGAGHLRFAQTISAGAVAAGHGIHDIRIPMTLVAMAVWAGGLDPQAALSAAVPLSLALAAGTLMGGHRIIRTLGRRLSDLSTAQGLAAESSTAIVLGVGVLGLNMPMSTSHTLASSVVGVGLGLGPRHLRWPVVARIVAVWLVTPVASAAAAAVLTVLALRLG